MKKNILILMMGTLLGESFALSCQAALADGRVALSPELHTTPLPTSAGPDLPISIWFDYGMVAGTLLDYAATKSQNKRTIDASGAIQKLQKALKGEGGGSSGSDGTSSGAEIATAYASENVMTLIEASQVKGDVLFDQVREAVAEYLFETSAPDIKGECTASDKDCTVERQNEWLLASVTLASATADKVLDTTAKKNVKDEKTEAEKSDKNTQTQSASASGDTSLTGHFEALAASFNAQKSPAQLYNAMAGIVLDTHRQINEANALMGRDLEAQGLRTARETGTVLFIRSETEE